MSKFKIGLKMANLKKLTKYLILVELILSTICFILACGNVRSKDRELSSNSVDDVDSADSKMSVEERFNHIPARVLSTMMRLTEHGSSMFKRGDTVRAYTPSTHRLCDSQMVSVFKMRLHPYSEALRALELHYYKMRSTSNRRGNFQVTLWALDPYNDTTCRRLGVLDLQNTRRGYQTTDITSEMTNQLEGLPEEILVGISFTSDESLDSQPSRFTNAAGTLSMRPFILIYAKQKERSSIRSLQTSFQESAARRRRSISLDLVNNNLDPYNHVFGSNNPQDEAKPAPIDPNQLSFAYFNDQNTLRRKMIRKQRKENRNGQKDENLKADITNNEIPLSASEGNCARHHLTVNFRNLGWGNFVIAPAQYDAYYCAGTCDIPEKEDISPSNHAAILNVMNALGASPVPLPTQCCVPDKMRPISLLYFNDEEQVVLKTFSDMRVMSCSCR